MLYPFPEILADFIPIRRLRREVSLKILCMTYEYPPIGGGGATVAHPLAVALTARGHTVDVVTSGMPDLAETETVDGIRIHRVRCRRRHRHYTTTAELSTWIWPAYRKARELHRRLAFDVNHTHFILPSGVASWLLYKKTGLPYMTTAHGSDVPGYNPDRFHVEHKLSRPLWRRIIADSACVISASCYLTELLRQYAEVPVEVIQNGFTSDYTSHYTGPKINRILVVTRLFRRKGVQFFLDALGNLDHDWEVIIAGDGPYMKALRDQVDELGLSVRFAGFVQGQALAELYASSKVFVFPSIQENFPTVLLEAMEAGCAIVTTSADGCAEVIGDAGIAVAPEQSDQIHAALDALIHDDERIAMLGRRARERIERFRWPGIAARYDDVITRALSSAPAPD